MESAIDVGNGSVVSARNAKPGRAYRCPNPDCQARVFPRSTEPYSRYRPYFAHANLEALPECEEFHPSSSQTGSAYRTSAIRDGNWNQTKYFVSRPELYVKDTGGVWELVIVLPQVKASSAWNGTISCAGKYGVQEFYDAQLRKSQEVYVVPSNDDYRFVRTGDVDDSYWAAIDLGLPGLNQGPTCFAQIGKGGRRVSAMEAIYWGQDLLVVLPPDVPVPDILKEICHDEVSSIGAWSLFGVTLPDDLDTISSQIEADFSRCLGHQIRSERARISFLDPLPHHIDGKGRFVFDSPTDALLLSIIGKPEGLSVLNGDGENVDYEMRNRKYLYISMPFSNEIFVYLDTRLMFVARTERCSMFMPDGIAATVDGYKTPLFEVERYLHDISGTRIQPKKLRLDLPNSQLLPLVHVGVERKAQSTLLDLESFDLSRNLEIDCGNFGSIDWTPSKKFSLPEVDGVLRQWFLWLIALPEPDPSESYCALSSATQVKLPTSLRALLGRRWSSIYQAQLCRFAQLIDAKGLPND